MIEHSHRLLASSIGLLTLLLVFVLWFERKTQNRKLLRLALLALFLVCVQALLGGLTVLFRLPPWISTAHLAVSLIFFANLLYIAVTVRVQNRRWLDGSLPTSVFQPLKIAAAVVYVQILVGALMRHLGAGLACVEIPLCQGTLLPHGHFALKLHLLHRLLGLITAFTVVGVSVSVWRNTRSRSIRALALAAPLLVCAQIAVGLWVIHSFLGVTPTTLHLGIAALLWANMLSLCWLPRRETSTAQEQLSADATLVRT